MKNYSEPENLHEEEDGQSGGFLSSLAMLMNTFSYLIFIVGLALIVSTFGILIANDVFAFVKSPQAIELELESETTLNDMSYLLEENDIIEYRWVFRLFGKLKEIESFEEGKYSVNSDMDYGQIFDELTGAIAPPAETVRVTVPEGYTILQIAKLMEEKGVCAAEKIIETANTYDFSHEFLEDVPMVENRLEGYLFPDTYEFYKNSKPVTVINKMLNNFDIRFTKEMRELMEKSGLNMEEVVIIASLIEKEAKINDERAIIAGVIYNRLDNPSAFPNLQIDASVLYAVGQKEKLTAEDLEVDSPYNTYKVSGLPPTAICNPGVRSMLAAIVPEEHGYHYYVANPRTGAHVFSRTLKEHNAAVAEMRKLED